MDEESDKISAPEIKFTSNVSQAHQPLVSWPMFIWDQIGGVNIDPPNLLKFAQICREAFSTTVVENMTS